MEGKKSGKENIFLFYKFAFQIFFLSRKKHLIKIYFFSKNSNHLYPPDGAALSSGFVILEKKVWIFNKESELFFF